MIPEDEEPRQLRAAQDRRAEPPSFLTAGKVHVPAIAWVGASVTIIVQIVALIWGAAKMSSSVDDLKDTVREARLSLSGLKDQLQDVRIELKAVETKIEDRQAWEEHNLQPARKP